MPSDRDNYLTFNLKSLLQEKLTLLNERFSDKRMATRYKMLTDAESRILAVLKGEALTISEVARRLNISRQAVHKKVVNLVQANLLQLESIPDNARDKRIVFTWEGEEMKASAATLLSELEQEVAVTLGQDNFKTLMELLDKEW